MRNGLMLVLAGLATCGCNQSAEFQAGYEAGFESEAGHATDERRFTKAEFSTHVLGRTKAQIRDELGPPDVVLDRADSWIYMSLAVFDADAGTRAQTVTLRFTGAPSPDDVVVDVTY